MSDVCYQVNLQRHFGGGEVYTQFLTRTLEELGWRVVLFIDPQARFWQRLDLGGARVVAVSDLAAIDAAAREPGALIAHAPSAGLAWERLCQRHRVACFCHMPVNERDPSGFRSAMLVLAVSGYVLETLRARGIPNAYPEPMYGIAALDRTTATGAGGEAHVGNLYDWDRRKLRDRILAATGAWWQPWVPRPSGGRRPGLTLGIVSRLTTIKQFPALFEVVAPRIAAHAEINLEVFGSGGYASVRDLKHALAPLGDRVRYWGHQDDVRSAYRMLDFVMSGLPEREALGLNLIEAQYCGTPVLAIDAPPFTETVKPGSSGWLYRDPRLDGGADFARVLDKVVASEAKPNPLADQGHLARFSLEAFRQRVAAVMELLSDGARRTD